jgi:hypothetical protein
LVAVRIFLVLMLLTGRMMVHWPTKLACFQTGLLMNGPGMIHLFIKFVPIHIFLVLLTLTDRSYDHLLSC